MSKFKVAITDYVFPNLDPEKEILAEVGAEVVFGQSKTKAEVIELVKGVDAVLNTYYGPIDGEVMDAMPDCKIIVRYGIGVDTIDVAAATQRGIIVANVPDYCIDEVSDHALAMFLSLTRKLPQADAGIRAGDWKLAGLKPLMRTSEMTVGVVGMGRIGRAIASKLAVFGVKIVFFDPYFTGDGPMGSESVNFLELCEMSDAIIVQSPSTPETRHMLDEQAFAAMQKKPIIINCARGELIDTDALLKALESGQVSGAGLDVIEDAPPLAEDHPFLKMSNVILTPHSAWFSSGALYSLQRLAAAEVARVLNGEKAKSPIN